MQTYNQIIKLNQQFADNHFVIKTFGNGEAYDIVLHDKQEWFSYPVMWMQDLPLGLNENEFTFNFRVYFIGQVATLKEREGDKMETNENEVKSDMVQCALDLLSFWAQDSTYPELDLVKSGAVTTITDRFSDRVTGCYVDLKLKQGFRYNKCAVPMTGVTPPPSETCQPVTFTLNGVEITETASGLEKTIIVQTDADPSVQVGTILTDTATNLIVEVPESFPLTRIYNPPAYSDAVDRSQDYDTYWRMSNDIGNYTQPMAGVAMRLAWGKYYLLHEAITIGNVFGNSQRWTGLDGGYFDWDTWYSSGKMTENYYDVDDVLTTRELAFPDGLAVDHWIGALIQIDVPNTLRTVEAHRNYGATLTIAGYTGFYLLSLPEMVTYGTWGDITLPYTSSPLFDWNSGLKVTGDSYPVSPTGNAMNAQAYGHFTSVPKANSNKAVFIKPFNPNTLL